MATSTITATIGLSGPGMTSQSLAVGRATTLVIDSPTIESGAQVVPGTVSTGFTTLIDGTSIGATGGYVYIKNTEPTTAATVDIFHGGVAAGSLKPGEWAFFPTIATEVIKVNSKLGPDTTCEFGFWTAA
jgi:hypothetical protein